MEEKKDLFVKPLKDGYSSIGRGEVCALPQDALEGLCEQVMSAHRPRASLADAKCLWQIGTMVLVRDGITETLDIPGCVIMA